MLNRLANAALAIGLAVLPFAAQAAGNLAANPTRLELKIDSKNLKFSQSEFQLETGKYYILTIEHDGGDEMSLAAPELFRNSWINQVAVDDLKVVPYGLYSVEFDDAATISLGFVPIRPGEFKFYVPGYENRGLSGKFTVK